MSKDIDVNSEPLPGYRLIEHIGSGGYGEVWRVEAPGGLTKAIKFVFGQQHEKRAVNESRALDHIRGVRHPFLLSLERIEVVDGRLLIVTELADGSVKDRFDLCRRDGLRGIPREELLSYLRDAADALDFMGGTHALQHLDIKPENLLLLAGHVKVADFGLVKDVRQSQASLVGGMTPLYAAPEVFRGAPSRHSDQYSLAIVYQEMLTGTLPFVGSSAAELTLHHLNDEPDLGSLTAVDRYSVSRALSKDPQHRYASCRELIDSLIKATDVSSTAVQAPESYASSPAAEFTDPKTRETQPTDFFDEEQPAGWNDQSSQMLLDLPESDCQLVDLPPLDLAGRDARPAPTLVLGIGGTAARVLTHFRRMLNDQWGNAQEIPAVQMLLVDTDARGISEATRDESYGLAADEVLSLPLRRPQHYRDNSQQLLHWLSRRWLYNIPRSLQTEGLRPLGRLALADQARQAGQRIRRSMVQALDPASLAKSSATVGQGFRSDAMRVIVVASISGGTGSGMSLDLGYAVRAILQKLGLAHAQTIGLMIHSTGRDARHSELARVNAFSWLTEYQHFQGLENPYPGDVSCGLPAHSAGVAAFDHTYLIQLGENLDGVEFEQATQGVAEYIRFNTLSPASAFFDACRASSAEVSAAQGQPAPANLRSFGIYRQSTAPVEVNDEFAGFVSQQVLAVWRGTAASSAAKVANTDGTQLVQRLHLDAAGIAGNARTLIELELGMEAGAFLAVWLKDHAVTAAMGEAATLTSIDQVFGRGKSGEEVDHFATLLGRMPADIVGPLAGKLCAEVRRWISRRIDDPCQRLSGAREALNWIKEHFVHVEAELQRIRGALVDRLTQIRMNAAAMENLTKNAPGAGVANPACSDEYFHMNLDQLTILTAEHVVYVIRAEAKAMSDEVISLGREVDQIAAAVGRTATVAATAAESAYRDSPTGEHGKLVTSFRTKLPEIAARVDAQLQAEYIESNGGLMKTIMQGGRPRAQLSAKLHELARKAVYQTLAGAAGGDGTLGGDLHTALAMATPAFLEYGGQRRVLAILPSDSTSPTTEATVSQSLGTSATAVRGSDGQLTICVEADRLSLQHIALDFVERRRDRVEFADRVHCRTDINWTPLVSAEAPRSSIVWGTDAARYTQPQNAMCKTMVL